VDDRRWMDGPVAFRIEHMTTDFELAFEAVPAALLITKDQAVQRCNRALRALFGLPDNRIVGRPLDELCVTPADAPTSRSVVALQGSDIVCAVSVHELGTDGDFGHRQLWSFDRLGSVEWPAVSLTPRQREIVSHLLCGATSKQIAQRLGLSHRTVDSHRRHLMQRLKVSRVAHLWSIVRTSEGMAPFALEPVELGGRLFGFASIAAN
jgi:DNA-binding CsgD family transcriptional regulator